MAESATILIPDISGYTEFVSKTELDHSSHIINHLLETIVQSINEDYVISEIEGDAVLLYRKGNPPGKKEIIDQVLKTFSDFHRELQLMHNVTVCQCGACQGITGLTLKFIVHFGAISEIKVQRFLKASGIDMVIAHRLLKNSIDTHEYLLVTKNYLSNIPDPDDLHNLEWNPSKEEYSSIGTVEFQFAPLEGIKRALPLISQAEVVIPYDDSAGIGTEINANYKDVFGAIINIAWRKYYEAGVKDVQDDGMNALIGKKHRCIYDDFNLEIEPMKVEVSDREINYAEYARIPAMNFYSIVHYTVTDLGDNRCKLMLHFYPEQPHVLSDEMLALPVQLQQATLKNFKAFAENGFKPVGVAEG